MKDKKVMVDQEVHRHIRVQSFEAGLSMGDWLKGVLFGYSPPAADDTEIPLEEEGWEQLPREDS